MKRAQEAEDAFRKAVQNAPDDTDLLRALAQQLDANGKKAEAEQLLSDIKRIETAKPEKQPQTPKFATE
jgi:Flp pilus assembly protein TadD